MVNKNLDYVKLRSADGSLYYFAQENLEHLRLEKQFKEKKQWIEGVPKLKSIAQIFKEHGGYEIEGTLKGEEMIGWKYVGPFDDLRAQSNPGGFPLINEKLEDKGITAVACHRVLDGGKTSIGKDIVVAGEGTGIVHTAPGCGDIDHKIGVKNNLVNIAPLDAEAKYIDGFGWLSGLCATEKETTEKIINHLKETGFLVYKEMYPHVYPHCWRSGDELVFRLVDEWYINMDWRDEIKKNVDEINWTPKWGNEREHEWLDNMGDWMISKKRFWGLALPVWTFEDDTYFVVGSKEELKALAVEGWDEFEGQSPHKPWIDKVKIRHPETGLIGTRIPDVGNPWLDAGIVPYSTLKYSTDREYWNKWFPGDFVTECFPGQFRNWFYSLLALSTIMENRAPFKTLLGHALVKDETGRDMHKSWGNAIWFDDAAEKMGVDVMRLMYANQNIESNLRFGYDHADETRKQLITFWNTYSFFATYAAVDGFKPNSGAIKKENLTHLDQWILSKMNQLIGEAREALDQYRVDLFMGKFERFIDDLSNWYVRRNRRRFWKSEDDSDKQTAYQTLYYVLKTSIQILAPILPFITEKIYQNLVRNLDEEAPESIHLCDYPEQNHDLIDEDLMEKVDGLKKLVELGRSARNQSNMKIRQPLSQLSYAIENDAISSFVEENQAIILDELNVKSIERITDSSDLIQYKIKPNLKTLGRKYGKGLNRIRTLLNEVDTQQFIHDLNNSDIVVLDHENESFEFSKGDVFIETEAAEGFSAISDAGLTVGLSLTLSDDLIQEGLVRDLIRQVQMMRKEAGFAVEDRIKIYWELTEDISTAMLKFEGYFKTETLSIELIDGFQSGDFEQKIQVRENEIHIGIKKI